MTDSVQVESPQQAVVIREPAEKSQGSSRLLSVDAFRGMIMFLMLAEAMHLHNVARNFPSSLLWRVIGFNTDHVPWQGCSLHDLIQPGFSFLVGAALPFSIASRQARSRMFMRPAVFHAGKSFQTQFPSAANSRYVDVSSFTLVTVSRLAPDRCL